jgi:hypothetical protein
MSDDSLQDTAPKATKALFGALGFILLMVGLEMLTDKEGIRVGLGMLLCLLGALSFYAAVFWESAKRILSLEAQQALGNFAQNRNTWLGFSLVI